MPEIFAQLKKPQEFALEWNESRYVISRYLTQHFSKGFILEAIFADLGHAGRLFPEFGHQNAPVKLRFSRCHAFNGNPETSELQAQESLSKFLSQMDDNIRSYPGTEAALSDSLSILSGLAQSPETQYVAVFSFGKIYNGIRTLTSIE